MKTLHSDWFVEGLQDFEYKKYLLLAYLQSVKLAFDQSLLYPVFSDVISHYQNLHAFQQSKLQFEGAFPKQMRAVDWEKFQVLYASLLADDEALREIEEIVEFSLPQVKATVEEGKQLYELIEENIEIETVGLLPLYRDAGYLLLRGGNAHLVKAYSYQITMFESANERYRGMHSQFVADFTLSIGTTYESIKWELIRQQRDLPNPATFSVYSKLRFPEEASLVPVAKRKFVRFLAEFND